MNINRKRIEYVNKEAFRLVGLIKETEEEKEKPTELKGSVKHQNYIDLSNNLINTPITISGTLFNKTISRKVCENQKCCGFDRVSFQQFEKFVNNLHKDNSIKQLVSREFVDKVVFDWIIKTYKIKQTESSFSEIFIEKINLAIKEYKIYYPIYYLEIGKAFHIGDVTFDFFTKEQFDNFANNFSSTNSEKRENPYEVLRDKYQGKVFCSCIVKSERNRAKEIALEKCSIAVDILKICSDTIDFPFAKLSFDIDSRTRENIKNEVIIQETSDKNNFNTDIYRLPAQHEINDKDWELILKRNLGIFQQFLSKLETNHTELENLILNAIKRFGNALSNSNLHQRIVELFTILESLLLKNQDLPIIDSVTKYCSKLVFKNPKDRKELIRLFKEMYTIRSAIIHHGINKEFEMDNLRKLQLIIKLLIIKLIDLSKKHETKLTIIDEIDEAILNAY
jgi:hypothetical protein